MEMPSLELEQVKYEQHENIWYCPRCNEVNIMNYKYCPRCAYSQESYWRLQNKCIDVNGDDDKKC